MRAFAHDIYKYPLPRGHRFPLEKYRLLRAQVEGNERIVISDARAATRDELALAHAHIYIEHVERGELTRREELALGLPWSPQLVERSRRSVGATISAASAALAEGVAANLGGGTHHAYPDSGRGFCVFNDVAVAARLLHEGGRVSRILIIDLDVHQGDGTHFVFRDDCRVFTFSINGFGNYPFQRVPGDLELDLRDGTGDDEYLARLRALLPEAIRRSRAEVCFYLAGADPYSGDQLGRLALTWQGLACRDELVRDALATANIPAVVTLAGGYADPIEDTVAINATTLEVFAGNEPHRHIDALGAASSPS